MNQERIRDINDDVTAPVPTLSPCPCGEEAIYYRVAIRPADATGRGKAVSAMTPGDFHENLCADCFRDAFGVDEPAEWVRLAL